MAEVRIMVTVACEEDVHPELVRDDVAEALVARGFDPTVDVYERQDVDVLLEVLATNGEHAMRLVRQRDVAQDLLRTISARAAEVDALIPRMKDGAAIVVVDDGRIDESKTLDWIGRSAELVRVLANAKRTLDG